MDAWQQRVDELTGALSRGLAASLALSKERFLGLKQRLGMLSPQAVLERGYAVVQRDNAMPVTSVTQVQPNDSIKVTVRDGSFGARVV